MHSSVGTGSLAYAVGSKVMDMRTSSKNENRSEAEFEHKNPSNNNSYNKLDCCSDWSNNCTDVCQRETSSDSAELVSVRESTDSAVYDYDSSCLITTSSPGREKESYFDFPSLPVTNLFERSEEDRDKYGGTGIDNRSSLQSNLRVEDECMHSFQINNNVDLIMESNGSLNNPEIKMVHTDAHVDMGYKSEIINRLRKSDIPEMPEVDATTSDVGILSEERVSEWLWTLHRIG